MASSSSGMRRSWVRQIHRDPAHRYNMRSALPMNLRAHNPNFQVFAGAQADIDRVLAIWTDCLKTYGGRDVCAGLQPFPVL